MNASPLSAASGHAVPLRVGVAGLGTVGVGVVEILRNQAALIAARAGRPIEVTAVSARDRSRDRGVDLGGLGWEDDAVALARRDDVDVVVELIGGAEGTALDLARAAFSGGKSFVTANKAMIAAHGPELAAAAEESGLALAFEAAVAGGIPILKALREGLAGNAVGRVYGILNGTCNYILTEMRTTGRDFSDVLAQAQALGYAEADPTFDVDGIDTAHKLAILAALAFGGRPDIDAIHVEGIRHVTIDDIRFAEELGFRIKLLGVARMTGQGLEQRVHPCMVPLSAPIAHVEGVFNAVVAEGDAVGGTMFQGRGAGRGPTASAVVADLIDIARGHGGPAFAVPAFSVPALALGAPTAAPIDAHVGAFYIRLMVLDQPGVLADVARAFATEQVSLESLIQRGRSEVEAVPVVLTTHATSEAALRRALDTIAALPAVIEPPRMIRIENSL
ncbi:homoserine dehydrogenase [Tistrella mobilis]|uniref:Homoserine dehydrogenase n=1 Tax=Tistrella mobilis TaxID=171437 RepID=A0A162LYH9_9PROT|nr:homoserine dehydrogenase [Tistrella mobilis]KYO57575.1 homoserine dehydrogenase [Tistrella mobilis]